MKKFLGIALLMGVLKIASAQQQPHCASDYFEKQLFKDQPAAAANYQQARQDLFTLAQQPQKKSATVYTIPVVVHVIYNTYQDNISKEQIEDALAVLNEDFRRMNSDTASTRNIFKPVAADVEVEFKLAKLDPNGNCTDGINRVQSSLSVDARNNVKPLSHWDNDRYLNIWVVNSISGNGGGTTLGYAYKPRYNQGYRTDGVLIRNDMMGRIGTATAVGRTLTHEVGHYLGLDHPFYDDPSNPNDNGCDFGDGIADTPPVASASFGCNLNRNSCSNDSPDLPDMIENYMDYADDVCTNLFTKGQKSVMRSSLETSGLRRELRVTSNLLSTGLLNLSTCAPQADFFSERVVTCPLEAVQFFDNSGQGEATSYSWSFPGGTPSSSTAENPVVIYNFRGNYPVSLTVSNAAGSTTYTDSTYITVRERFNGNNAQWNEDFESSDLPADLLVKTTYDNREFTLNKNVASSGSQSLELANNNENVGGEVDEIISPLIYTNFGTGMTLYFDYAFALNSFDNEDELNVYASTDCGKTWELRRAFPGVLLNSINGTADNTPYSPANTDWKVGTVIFDAYQGEGPILIKLEFTSGGGNNFFIDNIRFTADNISTEENTLERQLSVYPNPASDYINVEFAKSLHTDGTLILNDLGGRSIIRQDLKAGDQKTQISTSHIPAGIYLLKINSNGEEAIQKIILQ